MGDSLCLDIDRVGVLVLAGIYQELCENAKRDSLIGDHYKIQLYGFEKALRLVGIDPDMLKGVDISY